MHVQLFSILVFTILFAPYCSSLFNKGDLIGNFNVVVYEVFYACCYALKFLSVNKSWLCHGWLDVSSHDELYLNVEIVVVQILSSHVSLQLMSG